MFSLIPFITVRSLNFLSGKNAKEFARIEELSRPPDQGITIVFLSAKFPCKAERVFKVNISARHLRASGLFIKAVISSTK